MLLYKYYSSQKHNFEAVKERKFWFSTQKMLNDPYDLYSGISLLKLPSTTDVSIKKRIREILIGSVKVDETNVDSILSRVEKDIQSYASCSFTTNPIDRLMWAHYANSYSGFCICIEVDDDMIDGGYSQTNKWHRVMYMDQMPQALIGQRTKRLETTKGEDFSFDSSHKRQENSPNYYSRYCELIGLEDALRSYIHKSDLSKYIIQMLCIKAQEWVYEQEFRLITTVDAPSSAGGVLLPWNECIKLKEIILGNNMQTSVSAKKGGEKGSIKRLLEAIKDQHPDVRFSQLLLNHLRYFELKRKPYTL